MSQFNSDRARDDKVARGVKVAMPVSVLKFDAAAMTVDVQPLIKTQMDGAYISQPPLMAIPVACLCSGAYAIRPWYERGDTGVVIVGDADMDAALEAGSEAEPSTARNHAPEDGVFVGGLCAGGNAPQGLPDNALVLAAGSTYLAVSKGGVEIAGKLTVTGDVTAAGVSLGKHTHGGVETGGGSTSGPR